MEQWDLYDINGISLNKTIQRGDNIPEGAYHRVIHVWIMNADREFLIQKRAPHLTWFPDRWATTTGSMMSGESDCLLAAYREVEEELGLDQTKIELEYIQDTIIGNSIVSIYKAFLPKFMIQQIKINDEVSAVKWIKLGKINQLRQDNEFTTYSEELFEIVSKMRVE